MTDLRAHLDRLDTALAAATPGPWGKAWSNHLVDGDVHPDDAALIVAAVNALPALLAAVRAATDLADQWDRQLVPGGRYQRAAAADLHFALAAALTEGDAR